MLKIQYKKAERISWVESATVRGNLKKGFGRKVAVVRAVDECINKGILEDVLAKHRAEVENMFLTTFDEKMYKEALREEAREEALEEAREEAREEALEQARIEVRKEFAAQRDEVLKKVDEATRRADEATRRADEATRRVAEKEEENRRLREEIERLKGKSQ